MAPSSVDRERLPVIDSGAKKYGRALTGDSFVSPYLLGASRALGRFLCDVRACGNVTK